MTITITRTEIIGAADELYLDFQSLAHHALSGGFIDGATHELAHPGTDADEAAREAYPDDASDPGHTAASAIVTERRRAGFVVGKRWAREKIAGSAVVVTPDSPTHFRCAASPLGTTDDNATHHMVEGRCVYCRQSSSAIMAAVSNAVA